jgi:hypothetical protein
MHKDIEHRHANVYGPYQKELEAKPLAGRIGYYWQMLQSTLYAYHEESIHNDVNSLVGTCGKPGQLCFKASVMNAVPARGTLRFSPHFPIDGGALRSLCAEAGGQAACKAPFIPVGFTCTSLIRAKLNF